MTVAITRLDVSATNLCEVKQNRIGELRSIEREVEYEVHVARIKIPRADGEIEKLLVAGSS
jgi:hypothetical protein